MKIYHTHKHSHIHTHKYILSQAQNTYYFQWLLKRKLCLSMRILNIVMFLVKLLLMEGSNSGKQSLNQLISDDEDIFGGLSFFLNSPGKKCLTTAFLGSELTSYRDSTSDITRKLWFTHFVQMISRLIQFTCIPHCPNVTLSLENPT